MGIQFHASFRVGASVRAIPGSFLGLSVEYGGTARYEQLPGFVQLLQTLTVPGTGPTQLRLGDESADGTHLPPGRGLPGAYRLTPRWFATLASLVRAAHLRVSLHLRRRSPGQALYLRAPSPFATSRVTLGGASLRADGSWDCDQRLQPLRSTAGAYDVGVPPFTAVLVSVP